MAKKQTPIDDTITHEKCPAMTMIRAELDALNIKKLSRINVDMMGTVTRLRAVLPRLLELAPSIAREAPAFQMAHLSKLDLYLKALTEAEAVWLTSRSKNKEPCFLRAEGISLRAKLMSDVNTLISRGIVSEDAIQEVKGRQGYCDVAHDLLILSTILHDAWPSIEGKCAVTIEELRRASEIARELTGSVLNRRSPADAERLAALDRKRVFTLFLASYTEVRRTVQYVRFYEGDADVLAPSITGMRKGTRRKPKTIASAIASTQPLPAASSVIQLGTDAQKSESKTESKKPGIGLPGADPFLH